MVNWIDGEGGADIEGSGPPARFAITPDHYIWVYGYTSYHSSIQDYLSYPNPRRTPVSQLTDNDVVMDVEGHLHAVKLARPLSKMKNSDLAWLRGGSRENWQDEYDGWVYDLEKRKRKMSSFECVDACISNKEMYQSTSNSYPAYITTVYDLELADCHSYFAGFAGIWVKSSDSLI